MRKTFDSWIREQRKRPDPVGDLARDLTADDEWIAWSGHEDVAPLSFATYLYERDVEDNVEKAFVRAVAEWWFSEP